VAGLNAFFLRDPDFSSVATFKGLVICVYRRDRLATFRWIVRSM